jgi:hypothetical protein
LVVSDSRIEKPKRYPAGSSASRSSIEDCHHNVLCHPHRGHQSKIVITTCCVIRIAVINQRLSSHEMCHPAPLVIRSAVITSGVIATPLRHPLRGHHKVLCKEKVPDRCRGLSPKP